MPGRVTLAFALMLASCAGVVTPGPGASIRRSRRALGVRRLGDHGPGAWLAEHAAEFGFVMTLAKGASDVTCYDYEPWHYRWVSRDIALQAKASGSPSPILEAEGRAAISPEYERRMLDWLAVHTRTARLSP